MQLHATIKPLAAFGSTRIDLTAIIAHEKFPIGFVQYSSVLCRINNEVTRIVLYNEALSEHGLCVIDIWRAIPPENQTPLQQRHFIDLITSVKASHPVHHGPDLHFYHPAILQEAAQSLHIPAEGFYLDRLFRIQQARAECDREPTELVYE